MHITVYTAWGNDILHANEGISTEQTWVWTYTSIYKSIEVYGVNNGNIYLQYLQVLNRKALHLCYTSACNGLHETVCDKLGLEIAMLPRQPVTYAWACVTLPEIKLCREFCANMRKLLSSPLTWNWTGIHSAKKLSGGRWIFLRVQCNINVILRMMLLWHYKHNAMILNTHGENSHFTR